MLDWLRRLFGVTEMGSPKSLYDKSERDADAKLRSLTSFDFSRDDYGGNVLEYQRRQREKNQKPSSDL